MATSKNGLKIFTLKIEGFHPTSLRPEVVADYLYDLAKIIGPDADQRFHKISKASTNFAVCVPSEREVDVRQRAFLVQSGHAPSDARQGYDSLLSRLAKDKARGARLLAPDNSNVIEFPINKLAPDKPPIAITKSTTIQGQVIKVGGKNDPVPVLLEDVDGFVYGCMAKREIARILGKHIFGKTVRVHGTGKWKRAEDGLWSVTDFQIQSIEDHLDDSPLNVVIDKLSSIDAEWKYSNDPLATLEQIRNGPK